MLMERKAEWNTRVLPEVWSLPSEQGQQAVTVWTLYNRSCHLPNPRIGESIWKDDSRCDWFVKTSGEFRWNEQCQGTERSRVLNRRSRDDWESSTVWQRCKKIMHKMIRRWQGPYRLGEKVNNVTFEILLVPKNEAIGVRHVSEMKRLLRRKKQIVVSPECQIKTKLM